MYRNKSFNAKVKNDSHKTDKNAVITNKYKNLSFLNRQEKKEKNFLEAIYIYILTLI